MRLRSYYDILGLPSTASTDEIRRAYRKVIREYHPDLNPDQVKADRRSRELNAALDTLTHPGKRVRYDRQLERLHARNRATENQPAAENSESHSQQAAGRSYGDSSAEPNAATTGSSTFDIDTEIFAGNSLLQELKDQLSDRRFVSGLAIGAVMTTMISTAVLLVVLFTNNQPTQDAALVTQTAEPPVELTEPREPQVARSNIVPVTGPDVTAPTTKVEEDDVSSPIPPQQIDGASKVEPDPTEPTQVTPEPESPPPASAATAHPLPLRDLDQASITNSVGMQIQALPAGTFTRKTSDGVEVKLSIPQPFSIGVHEVTQEQYAVVMGENPSQFPNPQNPVEYVSYEDAVEFCERLSARSEEAAAGRVYRLPTEVEWEYACRADTTDLYCFDDADELLQQYAWFVENSESEPRPVGQKKPNRWGLYDMHGNVSEWCLNDDTEADENLTAAPNNRPASSRFVVARGGSWAQSKEACQANARQLALRESRAGRGLRIVMNIGSNSSLDRAPATDEESTAETAPRPTQVVLTRTEAAKFVRVPATVRLYEFAAIEPEAAERLSKYEGQLLLNGLSELSEQNAKRLSRHRGVLALNGLASLSNSAVESLSWHRSVLSLNGLTALTDAQAESLRNYRGELSLRGVVQLTEDQAESLSGQRGSLDLSGLESLSSSQAEKFSKHQGDLLLNGLTELTPAAAIHLGHHHGKLWLENVANLSDAAAEGLAQHQGGLFLDYDKQKPSAIKILWNR